MFGFVDSFMFDFIEQLLVIAGQLAFLQVVLQMQELQQQEVISLLILMHRRRQLVPSAQYTSPLYQHGPNQHE